MSKHAMIWLTCLGLVSGCTSSEFDGAVASPTIAAAPSESSYTLGSGDKVRITVFGEESLTGEFAVGEDGTIAFPLIGAVPGSGTTPTQVQEAIRARLANGYVRDPRVAVEVLQYRTFYILGEVNKPGEYPYRPNLTLDQAVATAGGYTYRANRKRLLMRHPNSTADVVIERGDVANVRIQPGDTVRIAERFF